MYYTLTVTCGNDLIGMYTISKNVNLEKKELLHIFIRH